MKIHLVTKLSRQVDGEYFFLNVLRGFTNKAKMHEFVNTTTFTQTEVIGGVKCMVEIGIIEDVEIEE